MTYSAEQYKEQLQQLMPRGVLWEQLTEQDTLFSDWLAALAVEISRIDARTDELLDETDPRTLYELLFDWEKYLGLPDACIGTLNTLQQRRDAVFELLTSVGGQSKQYFIALAASVGFVVTISEFDPFTVNSGANETLLGDAWQFAWQVNAPSSTISYFDVESGVNEALASWGNQLLECVINSRKPAHTVVLFAYA